MRAKTPEPGSLLDQLAAKGFRLTSQRKVLVETIQQASKHLDAATLLSLARKREPLINRATVYRTLELLKKLQLIDELDLMHLEGEKHFYEIRTDRQHVHLACCRCGAIAEFDSGTFDRLKREISEQTGFEIQVARLEVGGRCRACSGAARSPPAGR
ncbi:MAG TPA: Fur family transcriptional regulator [Terriglobia bacterium]|nr:Fur family transcriptional regulator [Terriglobia bacterium]